MKSIMVLAVLIVFLLVGRMAMWAVLGGFLIFFTRN